MEQIHIGTCIPGGMVNSFLPALTDKGFERFEICFHMEFGGVNLSELAPRVLDLCAPHGQTISALGLYCNPLALPEHIQNLKYAIDSAHLFGTSLVSTFAGALPGASVDEAMPLFTRVFSDLARYAADRGVRIAFENCPMGGTWALTTCNIAFSPRAWEMMFCAVPADNLGLEWEPAHALTQLIDPIAQLRTYCAKVFHVHGKDTSVDWDGIRRTGILSGIDHTPNRFPGFGDTNWRDIFYTLYKNGYRGDMNIEGYHDAIYNGSWEMTGQLHALSYLKWARGGDFIPTPWVK